MVINVVLVFVRFLNFEQSFFVSAPSNKIMFKGNPANIYLLKVSSRNSRKRCELCSKLTIKTPEPRQLRSIDDFEQVNVRLGTGRYWNVPNMLRFNNNYLGTTSNTFYWCLYY